MDIKKIMTLLLGLALVLSAAAVAEAPAGGTLYAGFDPWGDPLSVTLTDAEALSGVWRQSFGGDLFTQALENARDGFALEGPLGDSGYMSCRYTGTMVLEGETLLVTFTDGEVTSASTEGGSTSHHAAALDEAERTAALTETERGDYGSVTALDADSVEAFAAGVRQMYLDTNWYDMARLIAYPIALGPDTVIGDGEAFAAFMENSAISEADMEAMAGENCAGMAVTDEGIRMGTGQIILRDAAFDGGEQTGEPDLRIAALSGLAD